MKASERRRARRNVCGAKCRACRSKWTLSLVSRPERGRSPYYRCLACGETYTLDQWDLVGRVAASARVEPVKSTDTRPVPPVRR